MDLHPFSVAAGPAQPRIHGLTAVVPVGAGGLVVVMAGDASEPVMVPDASRGVLIVLSCAFTAREARNARSTRRGRGSMVDGIEGMVDVKGLVWANF